MGAYAELLKGAPIKAPTFFEDSTSVWHCYVIECDERDEVRSACPIWVSNRNSLRFPFTYSAPTNSWAIARGPSQSLKSSAAVPFPTPLSGVDRKRNPRRGRGAYGKPFQTHKDCLSFV